MDFILQKFLAMEVNNLEKFAFISKMLNFDENHLIKLATDKEALFLIKSEYHNTFGDFMLNCINVLESDKDVFKAELNKCML